jgi:hypothetical protein
MAISWAPIVNKEAGVSVRSKLNIAMGDIRNYTVDYDLHKAKALVKSDLATESQVLNGTTGKIVTSENLRAGTLYHVNNEAVSESGGSSSANKLIKLNENGTINRSFLNSFAGPTGGRPAMTVASGVAYFDTTIGKPIWFNGTRWVDANGQNV